MALAVSTETSSWSALTASPALTCHSTISASCRPSPRSRAPLPQGSGVIQHRLAGRKDIRDPGDIELFQAVQWRRNIRCGDPLDRRLQIQQGALVQAGGDLRADRATLPRPETGRAHV